MLDIPSGYVPISPSILLQYEESFLRAAPTPFDASSIPYDVVPPLPSLSAPEAAGEMIEEAGSRALWRGELLRPRTLADCRLGVQEMLEGQLQVPVGAVRMPSLRAPDCRADRRGCCFSLFHQQARRPGRSTRRS